MLVFSISTASAARTLPLGPQDIVPLVLKQSPQTREIQLQAQRSRLTWAEANQVFDFNITATAGYQLSKFESLTTPTLEENKTYSTQATLSKPFQTGTTLSLQYTGATDQPQVSTGTATDSTQDVAGILLEQNLWRNFFGAADRASLRAADAGLKASELTRLAGLQDLALTALQAYWKAYVAQETYDAAVKSQERYQKLVGSIQRKTRYGYANPAELAQAQAELENRLQTVKTDYANATLAMDQLKTLLLISKDTQIQFAIPGEIPAPPTAAKELQPETTRPVQAAHLSVEAAQNTLEQTQSDAAPDLSLIAQYYVQGLEASAGLAQKEMGEGVHPKYFIGLRFQHSFGSGYQNENILNKKYNRDLLTAQLDRKKLEFKDQEEDIKRRLQSTYSIYVSSQNQRALREKASAELSKTYTQGRTDISILIDSLNKYFDSEALVSESLANYQITLAQWQALQDQLVPTATAPSY
jgi:outer membrane protein TolC